MRFSLLPIGESFEYQSERYSKNGPLTAVNLANNQQRLIPRSALVTSLSDNTASKKTSAPVTTLEANTVTSALTQYHETCLQILTVADDDEVTPQEKLEQARQRFLADCGLK
jgi:hypothetical protein